LQAVSKPFGELADLIVGCVTKAAPEIRKTIAWIEFGGLPTNPEATWAQTKLMDAERMLNDYCTKAPGQGPLLDEVLRKVLEAKDCAVRALVFKS
jgi:hypothetical protein